MDQAIRRRLGAFLLTLALLASILLVGCGDPTARPAKDSDPFDPSPRAIVAWVASAAG